ncbi:MAG: chloride channel protein, partial [Lachnospiraceae bacterium]|nr:chloride channel protein [Lachnospiraceae bacterium]
MKAPIKHYPVMESAVYLLRWSAFSLVTGGAGGLIGGLFSRAIRWATLRQNDQSWMIFLLPFFGMLIHWLYRITGEKDNRGTNTVLGAVSAEEKLTAPTGPLIFVSTVLSHLGGASVGREGAALQLGGWLGAWLGKLVRLDDKDKRTAVMCGMSALFAALFGTPVAAAIFCIDVVSVGIFYYSALIP